MIGSAQASRRIIFVTHAQVEIDPQCPVPDWPLNSLGRSRHEAFSRDPVLGWVTSVKCSDERKARDGATIHTAHLGLEPKIVTSLGENDRSATSYLPPPEFEGMADAFFANPDHEVRGWESARAAQARMRCACLGRKISRSEDQPAGGGSYFVIQHPDWTTDPDWRTI